MWHDGWHSFLLVWVSACQKIPLSVLMRNPHKGLAREISHETGRGRGKESPRVKRRRQNREVDWTDQSTEQTRAENRAVSKREQELGCVVSDAGLTNVRWVSIPGNFVEISLEYTLVIASRCTESCTKVSQTAPFLRVRVWLFSFLPPSRLCMLCFVCP